MKLLLRLSLLLIILFLGPVRWLREHGMAHTRPISKNEIGPQGGSAVSVPDDLPGIFQSATDGMDTPASSTLRLFEDGRELGPPHTLHDTIRSQGKGAFSHWDHNIYFSSTDGSDPRTNKHIYKYVDHIYLNTKGGMLVVVVTLFLMVCSITLIRAALWISAWRRGASTISREAVLGAMASWVDRWSSAKVVAQHLLAPHSLARLAGLTALYSAVFLMIYCSLTAQRSGAGSFKINFEYKVF